MRTLKLTHEQIGIIQHALGIAENSLMQQVKQLAEHENARHSGGNMGKLFNARHEVLNVLNSFADLNEDIAAGKLDV